MQMDGSFRNMNKQGRGKQSMPANVLVGLEEGPLLHFLEQ